MIDYLIALATIIGIQTLLTLGLTMPYGITGLVNFGHVAFYALGAYASALLTLSGVPFVPAMAVGVVLAIAASLLVGTATLRLREDYFAILTLGFSELLRLLLLNARELTRGALGCERVERARAEAVAAHGREERLAVQRVDERVGAGRDGGRPRDVAQERDLAEDLPLADRRERAPGAGDIELAVGDEVDTVARLAFPHHGPPGRHPRLGEPA